MTDEHPRDVERFLKENNMTLAEGVEFYKKRIETLLK